MGKYCAAATVAAKGEQRVAVSVPPPTRYLYGDYDHYSIKQVFDNLHGNISLDPVRQHHRVEDEGGDHGGERHELVAAGLDGTALVSGDRGGC